MDGAQQVMIHFAADHEVRYLTDVPEPGDFVTHRNELWIARSVHRDGGGVTVVCAPSAESRLRAVSEDSVKGRHTPHT